MITVPIDANAERVLSRFRSFTYYPFAELDRKSVV